MAERANPFEPRDRDQDDIPDYEEWETDRDQDDEDQAWLDEYYSYDPFNGDDNGPELDDSRM